MEKMDQTLNFIQETPNNDQKKMMLSNQIMKETFQQKMAEMKYNKLIAEKDLSIKALETHMVRLTKEIEQLKHSKTPTKKKSTKPTKVDVKPIGVVNKTGFHEKIGTNTTDKTDKGVYKLFKLKQDSPTLPEIIYPPKNAILEIEKCSYVDFTKLKLLAASPSVQMGPLYYWGYIVEYPFTFFCQHFEDHTLCNTRIACRDEEDQKRDLLHRCKRHLSSAHGIINVNPRMLMKTFNPLRLTELAEILREEKEAMKESSKSKRLQKKEEQEIKEIEEIINQELNQNAPLSDVEALLSTTKLTAEFLQRRLETLKLQEIALNFDIHRFSLKEKILSTRLEERLNRTKNKSKRKDGASQDENPSKKLKGAPVQSQLTFILQQTTPSVISAQDSDITPDLQLETANSKAKKNSNDPALIEVAADKVPALLEQRKIYLNEVQRSVAFMEKKRKRRVRNPPSVENNNESNKIRSNLNETQQVRAVQPDPMANPTSENRSHPIVQQSEIPEGRSNSEIGENFAPSVGTSEIGDDTTSFIPYQPPENVNRHGSEQVNALFRDAQSTANYLNQNKANFPPFNYGI